MMPVTTRLDNHGMPHAHQGKPRVPIMEHGPSCNLRVRVFLDWSSQLSLAIDAAEYRIKHELLGPGGLPLGPAGASS